MFGLPTRRNMLGAGVFAASSLLGIGSGVAQAQLAPTPACHDGDEPTLAQTAGPFFKPSSPERIELLEAGMAGQPIELVGFVLTRNCKPVGVRCWISGTPTTGANTTIPASACAATNSPTRKGASVCEPSCPASMSAARVISM